MNRPRRPRMKQALHVGGLLEQLLSGLGLDERLRQARALVIWEEVVGPQIAAHTRARKLRDGVLEVGVDQPTWMQQLQLMKPQILRKLNAELGDAPVRDIFLKRGKLAPRAGAAPEPGVPWRRTPLDAAEQQQLAQLVAGLDDPELRREMTSLLGKQLRLHKARTQQQATDSQSASTPPRGR
ncbi:MAG: DUF721 domain-containing protein [Desulfuromonadales bacterium]|nr:DUF721 domain-containing protein [Desulfuromonadales bacterium]